MNNSFIDSIITQLKNADQRFVQVGCTYDYVTMMYRIRVKLSSPTAYNVTLHDRFSHETAVAAAY